MTRMSDSEVQSALGRAPAWSQTGESIQRTLRFQNFLESMAFVNRLAQDAERLQHHPDILIRYNKVTLTLSTHDAGGLTSKDFDLASIIDTMAPASA